MAITFKLTSTCTYKHGLDQVVLILLNSDSSYYISACMHDPCIQETLFVG